MDRRQSFLVPLGAALALAACATSDIQHTNPGHYSTEYNVILKENFDAVWLRLVKNLASDFFVINNIEKDSHIINVSFSSSTPSEFIDCGKSTRTFSNLRGTQNVIYNTADSTNFTVTSSTNLVYYASRKTYLEGRSNIYVAPNQNGTEINVNTKYVLSIKIRLTDVRGRPAGTTEYNYDFTTKRPLDQMASFKGSLRKMKCVTNGKLEKLILDYARPK